MNAERAREVLGEIADAAENISPGALQRILEVLYPVFDANRDYDHDGEGYISNLDARLADEIFEALR